MPRKSEWILRIPDALTELNQFPAPVVDRAALERLLGVQRRMAIRLMHRFGGFQAGRTFLVDRVKLIKELSSIGESTEYHAEQKRWLRFAAVLDEARKVHRTRQVAIPQPAPGQKGNLTLEPGRLEIRFKTTVELLQALLELAEGIGSDFEGVRSRIEPNVGSLPRLL